MRVIYGALPPAQLSIPWGHSWFDAARDWAARHGWEIESQTPGQRIQVNGQWYSVVFAEPANEWQIVREEP